MLIFKTWVTIRVSFPDELKVDVKAVANSYQLHSDLVNFHCKILCGNNMFLIYLRIRIPCLYVEWQLRCFYVQRNNLCLRTE